MYQKVNVNPSIKRLTPMNIRLNGEPYPLSAPCHLRELIDQLDVNLRNVAIELNRRIIPRSQLDQVTLADGDTVEVVEFIGGG